MEFSYTYDDTMRRLAVNTNGNSSFSGTSVNDATVYPIMMVVDVSESPDIEVPVIAFNKFMYLHNRRNNLENVKMVLPLSIVDWNKSYAGAEAILKYFSRGTYGRLVVCKTKNNDVYYGNNGIILDKDLTPLFLSTAKTHIEDNGGLNVQEYHIYLHPKVFTDDTSTVNKSLAKKGIAYYLSRKADSWRTSARDYKVFIEDPSKFLYKPAKPDINHLSSKDFNQVLKDNISEVLKQVLYDSSWYI